MTTDEKPRVPWLERRLPVAVPIALAIAVFIFTWVGIKESRNDSLQLLVMQGTTFTEALAQAATNAIESEATYDYFVHLRYQEIALDVSQIPIDRSTDEVLAQTAMLHDLEAVYLCDLDGNTLAVGATPGGDVPLPDWVLDEIRELGDSLQTNYVLLLEPGSVTQPALHYYLQVSNNLDRIVVVVADAQYYVQALRRTQIGYLVQDMSREPGVEYIIYQSTEGIIFASRKTGQLLKIENDPFLAEALDADSIRHREYTFQGKKVLELVRPFATDEYPFGLFRVGLSLDRYDAVTRGFDRQMVALAVVLLALVLLSLLYFGSRRKRSELRRQYSSMKSMTDTIMEQMKIGVAAIDHHGRITLVNGAFERLFDSGGMNGRMWDEVVAVPDLARARLEDLKNRTQEEEFTAPLAGVEKTLLVAVSAFSAGRAGESGLVIVVYDVTRFREYQRKSARQERLSEMGNLAAGVAHEIRNPLNTISIAAQRLATEFSPGDNQEEFVGFTDQIRSETKRLNAIITRFLALARESKEAEVPVSLTTILSESVDFFRLEAEKLGLELVAEIEPGLEVRGQADPLRQVLTNLYSNAREAVPSGTGKIRIAARRDDARIVVTIEDNGPGIPREQREKVFTPYFTTKEAGTGLGLPTVHRIITDMGGEIRVEESDLGGAKFVIVFAE